MCNKMCATKTDASASTWIYLCAHGCIYFGNSVSITKYLVLSERRTAGPEELITAHSIRSGRRWQMSQHPKTNPVGDGAGDVNDSGTERQDQIFIAI